MQELDKPSNATEIMDAFLIAVGELEKTELNPEQRQQITTMTQCMRVAFLQYIELLEQIKQIHSDAMKRYEQ